VEGPGKGQAGTRGCPVARRRTKGPTSGGRNRGTEGLRVVHVVARFLGSERDVTRGCHPGCPPSKVTRSDNHLEDLTLRFRGTEAKLCQVNDRRIGLTVIVSRKRSPEATCCLISSNPRLPHKLRDGEYRHRKRCQGEGRTGSLSVAALFLNFYL
jgi:hypothetical protein